MPARTPDRLPNLHSRYDIQSLIGEGGMARTYRAQDLSEDRPVAIKHLMNTADQSDRAKFTREFEILYNLHHPNLPEVHDLVTTTDGIFYTMELIEGSRLDTIIGTATITREWFDEFLTQFLATLDYLHSQTIVHSDLKPGNLILSGSDIPVLKIIDFGLATHAGRQKGDFTGTIQYAAPEIIKKEAFDHRSDLYSLGVILYELLTGTNPFDDENVVNVVVHHLQKEITTLESQHAFVDDRLRKTILKLLTKDPAYRYQDVHEVVEDLGLSDQSIHLHGGFYGRESEAGRLREWLSPETSRVVALQGPAGTGKSLLLHQWKLDGHLSGRRVVASPFREGPGLSNIRSLLRRLIHELPESAIPGNWEGEVRWIRGEAEWRVTGEETTLILHLVQLTFDLIKPAGPLLLLIDDADTGSPTDREYVSELARRWLQVAPTGSCLGLVTGEPPPGAMVLEVRNFRPDRLTAIIGRMLNTPSLPDGLEAWTAEQTGGNPFLIQASLLESVHSGALVKVRQQWRWHPDKSPVFSQSIRNLTRLTWHRLSPNQQRVLEGLAFAHRSMKTEWLIRLLEEPALSRVLLALERAGLVRRGPDGCAINHLDLAAFILEQIPASRQKKVHGILARIIAETEPKLTDHLAFHFARSDDQTRALPYLLQTAERAQKQLLLREAVIWYAEAARILESEHRTKELLDVLFKSEEVLDRLGRRDEQELLLQKIAVLCDPSSHPEDRIRSNVRRANYAERQARFEEAQKICEDTLPLAETHAPPWTGPLYRLLGKTLYSRAQYDQAQASYEKAYRAAQATANLTLQMESLNSLGTVCGSRRNYAQASSYFEKALILAEQLGDPDTRINALFNLGLTAEKNENPSHALEYYRKALPIIQAANQKKAFQKYAQYAALSHFSMHQYEPALELYRTFYDLSLELNDAPSAVKAKVKEALVMDRLGMFERASPLLEEALEESSRLSNAQDTAIYQLYLAEACLRARKYSSVLDPLRKALAHFKPDSEWAVLGRLTLLRTALETNFVLVSEAEVDENFGDIHAWIPRLNSVPASLRILGYSFIARMELWRSRHDDALTHSKKAVEWLDSAGQFDYDPQEVWFHHYRILRQVSGPRNEQAVALKRAFEAVEKVEIGLKKSDHRSAFMAIPLHRQIAAEHHEFFADERESDIRSFQQLVEIARNVNSTLDADTLFERIMDDAISHSQADRGLIILGTPDESEFEIRVARNMDRESLADISNISRSIVQEVFQSGRPVATADANMDDRFRERKSIMAFQIRSILCVPLRIRDRLIGAVYLDKRFDTNYFGPHQLKFLESFADLAGLAIENARLFERVSREKSTLEKENVELRTEIQGKYVLHNLVGQSKAMRRIYHLIESAADNAATVLIEGESGTGKELVARAIHYNGRRRQRPFVAVDCGALPENLLESELFGYKKGAFTGATNDKTGLFEEANRGTIFLDEITNTSLNFQARLLRVLQEGEIRRVGDNTTRKIDVRVIAATNQSLEAMLRAGTFREDLYYRLNVVPIQLPALRERPEDIPLLVEFLVHKHAVSAGRKISAVSQDLMNALTLHNWPGNVRELENVIQRMIVFTTSERLSLDDLPAELAGPREEERPTRGRILRMENPSPTPSADEALTLDDLEVRLAALEADFFRRILESVDGNKSKAAEQLGIKRTTLNDRLKKLGLL